MSELSITLPNKHELAILNFMSYSDQNGTKEYIYSKKPLHF